MARGTAAACTAGPTAAACMAVAACTPAAEGPWVRMVLSPPGALHEGCRKTPARRLPWCLIGSKCSPHPGGYALASPPPQGLLLPSPPPPAGPWDPSDPHGPPQPPSAWQAMLQAISGIVHFFGRLSFLVDENAHAVHFFISALLQLLDRCTEEVDGMEGVRCRGAGGSVLPLLMCWPPAVEAMELLLATAGWVSHCVRPAPLLLLLLLLLQVWLSVWRAGKVCAAPAGLPAQGQAAAAAGTAATAADGAACAARGGRAWRPAACQAPRATRLAWGAACAALGRAPAAAGGRCRRRCHRWVGHPVAQGWVKSGLLITHNAHSWGGRQFDSPPACLASPVSDFQHWLPVPS